MGCDGGTIPRRDELVKTKQKPEQKDKDAEVLAKWKFCSLSSNRLRRPIVSCELGRLYNKDTIIEYLLNKDSNTNEIVSHIRSLKDVVELKLTENTAFTNAAENGGEYIDTQDSEFICPVVGSNMSGLYRFCYYKKCGCVVSERAIKQVESEACLKCEKPLDIDNYVVIINGSEEEVASLRRKMDESRLKAKQEKKRKRTVEVHIAEESTQDRGAKRSNVVNASATQPSTSGAKISMLSTASEKLDDKYSIAKDPSTSETYKSIFTSHKSAQNKPKAHWVTFNPLYF